MDDDELGTLLIGCAIQVHRALGPGLLESVYETCLLHELGKTGLQVKKQVAVPFTYDGIRFDDGFRIDILFGNRLIIELKATERLLPIHLSQDPEPRRTRRTRRKNKKRAKTIWGEDRSGCLSPRTANFRFGGVVAS